MTDAHPSKERPDLETPYKWSQLVTAKKEDDYIPVKTTTGQTAAIYHVIIADQDDKRAWLVRSDAVPDAARYESTEKHPRHLLAIRESHRDITFHDMDSDHSAQYQLEIADYGGETQ